MPVCSACSKFLPKSFICNGCGLNNKQTSASMPLNSTLIAPPPTQSQADNVVADLGTITSTLNNVRAELNTIGEIKQKLSSLDRITSTLEQCLLCLENLRSSVLDLNLRVDSISSAQHQLATRCDKIEARLADGINVNATSSTLLNIPAAAVSSITKRIDRVEKHSRDYELAITGLPDFPNDSMMEVISKIATALNASFSNSDIASAIRIRSQNAQSKPLILRYISVLTRDAWLAKKKIKRNLLASEIMSAWSSNPVYVNERSTS